MSDRTQTLSVELPRDLVQRFMDSEEPRQVEGELFDAFKTALSGHEELAMIALALKNQGVEGVTPERGVELLIERLASLSQPEHQGDESYLAGQLRAYAQEFEHEDSEDQFWRGVNASRTLRAAARALDSQPPAPVLSDEERERIEEIARSLSKHGYGGYSAFLRNLASQEHRGEETRLTKDDLDWLIGLVERQIDGLSEAEVKVLGPDRVRIKNALRDLRQPPAGEIERLRERLLGKEALQAGADAICLDPPAPEADLNEVRIEIEAALNAAFPPPSDPQGDQERPACYRSGDGSEHDEAFQCEMCERPVCGYCATRKGDEWLCPDCNPAPTEQEPTIEELAAQGRCPECGALQGIWHKLGCSRDPERKSDPAPTQVEVGSTVRLSDAFGGGLGRIVGDHLHSAWPTKFLDGPRAGEKTMVHPSCMTPEQPEGGDEGTDTSSQADAPSVPDQFEGGDEEDWPEVWVWRDSITGKLQTTTGSSELSTIPPCSAVQEASRRYGPQDSSALEERAAKGAQISRLRSTIDGLESNVLAPLPATSQDSSELEEAERVKRVEQNVRSLFERARKAEKALERAEAALKELADEFVRRAEGDHHHKEAAAYAAAALLAREKAAELKGGSSGE